MTHEKLGGSCSGNEELVYRQLVQCVGGFDMIHRTLVLLYSGPCLSERFDYGWRWRNTWSPSLKEA